MAELVQNAELTSMVKELNQLINDDLVEANDRKFAGDLVKYFGKHGGLTDKQAKWVPKLIERAVCGTEETEVNVGSAFQVIIELFNKAAEHIKYPKITLNTGFHKKVVQLSLAGSKSKYKGCIQVTDGRKFGENTWYGRITPEGIWVQSNQGNDEERKAVLKTLRALGNNTISTVSAYGKETGYCCFCNSQLTDEKSVAAGFGPVCANNYNLHDQWLNAIKEELKNES